MIGNTWWLKVKAGIPAKKLDRARRQILEAQTACEKSSLDAACMVAGARKLVVSARREVEELPALSLNAQGSFFRIFESLEECLDYAAESLAYDELAAAHTDLRRATDSIGEALLLLRAQTGIKLGRPIFPHIAHRLESQRLSLPFVRHASATGFPCVDKTKPSKALML